jgi:hypothetical protein
MMKARFSVKEAAMKVLIEVSAADDAKAWALMVRHSPGVALPNRRFIVSEDAVSALREAGIQLMIFPLMTGGDHHVRGLQRAGS